MMLREVITRANHMGWLKTEESQKSRELMGTKKHVYVFTYRYVYRCRYLIPLFCW